MPGDRDPARDAAIRRQAARSGQDPAALLRGARDDATAVGQGQSSGVPAAGRHEGIGTSPTGGPGVNHWQEARIQRPGLDDRGTVFFAAVEMTRMPMVVTDPNLPDNPIVFANGAFLDLTGFTPDDILGLNCRFLQGVLTSQDTIRQLRDAVREHRPFAAEILNYRKDGTAFWNALFIGPIFDADGQLLYFFASQLDVTRRRNSEDAFRQSQKMEAIGQLTAGLAHDFNNALQVILGNLKRLQSHATDPAQVLRAADRAARAGEQAAKLTKQLVTFARKTRLEPQAVQLDQVVAEFADMLSRTLGGDIVIRYEAEDGLPSCVLDPVHAEMALLNILANARDAMPGGGRATVRTRLVELDAAAVLAGGDGLKPGRYIELSVEDDGPGMSPEVLSRAAEPFFTTRKGQGSGLGLAMVHGFVRQSGGRLEISSEPGRGTTVAMLFPVAAEVAPPPRTAWAEPVLDPRGGAETILVVEDNDDVLDLAVHHLSTRGYHVLAARSGEEALRILAESGARVDLLFSDIVMPGGINGLVLADRARAMIPGLRVLLTTGYNEDLVQARGAGGDPVLGKPYRETELAARIRQALNRPDGQPAAGSQHEG
ncbi:histidine kinase famiy protein [Paracraurococcus ruber]|uniref:histidine kinase n=1 Tax=Paracraurococcus ruber TaxID=77675 RepID=A0ABS1CTZ5_9PROT|nr:histidine kinase famiy protein [Paracraurococcus ruber]MBK1657742.1 hybrid sensor histidine kinase/response regulator [Paracraurococcus ruber]TDG30536.1 PAS domain-containing protein [Paracraurococcus ruber]